MRRVYAFTTHKRTSSKHTYDMRNQTLFSRAVLALFLVWRGATSYTQLSSIVDTRSRDFTRARGVTEQRCFFPRPRNAVGILKSRSSTTIGGNCCDAPSNRDRTDNGGRSSPPAEGDSSRRQFLRQLVGSWVTVLACSSVVGATGTTASAEDSVPDESSNVSSAVAVEGVEGERPAGESTASSAISGFVAGAAVSTSKQLLLYPVDTVKTRLQVRKDGQSRNLFGGLYDGILPPLIAGLPSGALFFAAKDGCSTAIGNVLGSEYADLTTVAAVGLAQFPYWGLRTPSELLKIRSQAGVSSGGGGGLESAKSILADEGVRGLYTGYSSNIAYAFPADVIKFLVYGAFKRSAKRSKGGAKLTTVEAAILGAGASVAAQAVTTPLDVVRTRVMTAPVGDRAAAYEGGILGALKTISREDGFAALWAGTTPRVARAVLSGAIQFGSYEFVKELFGVEPRKL